MSSKNLEEGCNKSNRTLVDKDASEHQEEDDAGCIFGREEFDFLSGEGYFVQTTCDLAILRMDLALSLISGLDSSAVVGGARESSLTAGRPFPFRLGVGVLSCNLDRFLLILMGRGLSCCLDPREELDPLVRESSVSRTCSRCKCCCKLLP